MEWIKIFAREDALNDHSSVYPQQVIARDIRICMALQQKKFLPFRINVPITVNRLAKDELTIVGKLLVLFMDLDWILMTVWSVTPGIGI